MKKVLIMSKALGGGGAEVALIELLNKMSVDEYDITLALLDDDTEYASRLTRKVKIIKIIFANCIAEQLVSMYSFPAKILKKLSVNRIIPYYDMLFDSVLTKFDEEYDLALDFYGYGYFLTGFMAERIKAKKKATWLHDEKIYWFKSVERYVPYYSKIYGVSQAVRDSFCKKYPGWAGKTEVFYNVIDVGTIIKKSKQITERMQEGHFNILTVGRLTEQKGYDIAIHAAALLKQRQIDVCWYAIGAGRDEKKLKALARKCGVEDTFIFMGRQDNPYSYMTQCDLYVQPSRHEGYVITLVEARVLTLPIVTSDIPSAREQIEDGVNGYIVPLNAKSVADKIEQLYKNPKLIETAVNKLKATHIDFSGELEKLQQL